MKNVLFGAVFAVLATPAMPDSVSIVRPPEKHAPITQSKVDDAAQPGRMRVVVAGPKNPVGLQSTEWAVDARTRVAPTVVAPRDLTTQSPRFFTDLRPPVRSGFVPRTRWQHMRGHELWTRAALSALKEHGKPLVDLVPGDIETWCPAYETANDQTRRAFWVGFLSALAKHESTYKPWAVGGGGRWYGLLQILPGTARGYECNVGTGEALKNGAANLSCAVRIMAVTVPRDGVIYGPGGRGVAADWGPLRSAAKRRDMAGWLRRQNYCKPIDATRPRTRP